MSNSLNVIGLISGGKDSLYSLLHCIQNGHRVVALANLYPKPSLDIAGSRGPDGATEEYPGEELDDLNSFMYQTVGHSVIPLYAEALGLPLYRRQITGTALVTDRDYSRTLVKDSAADEIEDLLHLLEQVKTSQPSANAVSTGAIQSTYQRTRVESVALRLGLVPLSYLWQYPLLPPPEGRPDSLTGLLQDMAIAGCDARIIKIASGGISQKLLWKNVSTVEAIQSLVKGLSLFFPEDDLGLRGAVLGEGGEFETLAIDGPRLLWRNGRIVVDTNPAKSWTGEGGTSYVRLEKARVVQHEKDDSRIEATHAGRTIPVPGLLDPQFQHVQSMFLQQLDDINPAAVVESLATGTVHAAHTLTQTYSISENTIHIRNQICESAAKSARLLNPVSAVEQMQDIVTKLPQLLAELSTLNDIEPPVTTASISHVTLILRSINDFAVINPIYASMYTEGVPNPPARVTFAAPLPDGVDISMSVIVSLGPRAQRRGLHVQGRSYWAPANIGPYSQAIATPLFRQLLDGDTDEDESRNVRQAEIVYLAGQIPLVSSTMELLQGKFVDKAILSLQHLWRVGQELKMDVWDCGIALLARNNQQQMSRKVEDSRCHNDSSKVARFLWEQAHLYTLAVTRSQDEDAGESEDDVDVWHMQNNRSSLMHETISSKRQTPGSHLHPIPPPSTQNIILPPLVTVEVSALPRNAEVEWWSTGLKGVTIPAARSYTTDLTFHTQSSDLDVCSTLVATPLNQQGRQRAFKSVTYLVKSGTSDSQNIDKRQRRITTIDELLRCSENTDSAESWRLVSGIAYVTAEGSTVLKSWQNDVVLEERSTSTADSPKWMNTTVDGLVGEAVSTIPCYSLFGHGGQTVEFDSNHSTMTPRQTMPEMEKLDLAFLFRFEAI